MPRLLVPLGYLKNSGFVTPTASDVVAQPANAFAVALSHHDRAHEDLDRPNVLEIDLAFARCLVYAEYVS